MNVFDASPFPDPRLADDEGLVAIGGDFGADLLLLAYAQGIFPWPCADYPYAWFSPNPRTVLRPAQLHVARSLRKARRRKPFRITYDTAFERVMRHCADMPRPGQDGTWIVPDLRAGYLELHRLGFAHSVETWLGDRLVGGLYGLAIGTAFSGESMFYIEPDASKIAFVDLVSRLRSWGFRLVDCQIHTEHLARFGARDWPRDAFLDELAKAVREPRRPGSWQLSESTESTNEFKLV